MTENKFVEEVKKLGININDTQLKQLNRYYELLVLPYSRTCTGH